MTHSKAVLIVVYALCLGSPANVANSRGRTKRELRFPKGASLLAGVSLASPLPKGPTDGLVHFLEFDLGFPFPEEFSTEKKQAQKKVWKNSLDAIKLQNLDRSGMIPRKRKRTKRNSKDKQRKDLLFKLEDAINRLGFNGFSCVSRLRCELRGISPHKSLLEQLLVALFKQAPEPDEGHCQKHQKNCQISLLQIIMHSEQIS